MEKVKDGHTLMVKADGPGHWWTCRPMWERYLEVVWDPDMTASVVPGHYSLGDSYHIL